MQTFLGALGVLVMGYGMVVVDAVLLQLTTSTSDLGPGLIACLVVGPALLAWANRLDDHERPEQPPTTAYGLLISYAFVAGFVGGPAAGVFAADGLGLRGAWRLRAGILGAIVVLVLVTLLIGIIDAYRPDRQPPDE